MFALRRLWTSNVASSVVYRVSLPKSNYVFLSTKSTNAFKKKGNRFELNALNDIVNKVVWSEMLNRFESDEGVQSKLAILMKKKKIHKKDILSFKNAALNNPSSISSIEEINKLIEKWGDSDDEQIRSLGQLSIIFMQFSTSQHKSKAVKLNADATNKLRKVLSDFENSESMHHNAINLYGINEDLLKKSLIQFSKTIPSDPLLIFEDIASLNGFTAEYLSCTDEVRKNELISKLFESYIKFVCDTYPDDYEIKLALTKTIAMAAPHNWYPGARAMKRKIIYHSGPTNSGKTFTALQKLKTAGKGIYLGPLRLLALEIYESLNKDGVYTTLRTGQELIEVPFATHVSATMEMADLSMDYDVAVMDEIQIMADEERGYAWSRALLGLKAKEIHVAGDSSAATWIENFCKKTGDEFELKTYERFTGLTVEPSLQGRYDLITKGDCVIAFSRKTIYELKKRIESSTKFRCCVVYGKLPSETRTQQAKLFNNVGTPYDVLVASDAVGMGLNLNIKRIIFSTVLKFNGSSTVLVDPSQIRQIAGRAGRRSSIFPQGFVTSMDDEDLEYVQHCLDEGSPQDVKTMGIFPSIEQIEAFAQLQDSSIPFSELLDRVAKTSIPDKDYHICAHEKLMQIAKCIDDVKGLTIDQRFTYTRAPCEVKDLMIKNLLVYFANAHANGQQVKIMMSLPKTKPSNQDEMQLLERKYNALELYVWFTFRFPEQFTDREEANRLREVAVSLIAKGLESRNLPDRAPKNRNNNNFNDRFINRNNDRKSYKISH